MTTESSSPRDGADDAGRDVPPGEVPNPQTGAGLGAGEPSSFEPEEDPETVSDPG